MFKHIIVLSHLTFNPDIQQTKYVRYMSPFVLAFPMIVCAPVAIFFGVKFNLRPALVISFLLNSSAAAVINVLEHWFFHCMTLWFDLVGTFILVSLGIAFLNTFPVTPFAVAVNLMLLVLSVMCLTYFHHGIGAIFNHLWYFTDLQIG